MGPYYDLEKWKEIARRGDYLITETAQQTATYLGFDDEDILDCCYQLDLSHFNTKFPSHKKPDLWQDEYNITYEGLKLYVKIQMGRTGKAVVISFKEDTSW